MSEEKNEEKLVTKDDSHFVFVCPKAIIESSGTTWASETIRLRQRHPDLFDVQENCEAYSTEFRQACATIENACFLYDDMTETEDLSRAQAEHTCIYTQYECKRLQHLKIEIKPYLSDEEMMDIEAENKILLGNVKSKLEDLTEKINQCLSVADRKSKQQFQNGIRNVAYCCRDTIALIKDLKYPLSNQDGAT
ncbi:Transient receptor potential cation channel subfamily A member 1 [Paramuricea clavata]|uniref:Transient receptor potential cation channel subfamily A member 1 n=1 Tax=Paramuricea clavata TaxID=317549 RepID=A0A7D9IP56_PARCT|nr:Transient receptor potential cation channel subfamily A member 1 [Paramuricea clavata]